MTFTLRLQSYSAAWMLKVGPEALSGEIRRFYGELMPESLKNLTFPTHLFIGSGNHLNPPENSGPMQLHEALEMCLTSPLPNFMHIYTPAADVWTALAAPSLPPTIGIISRYKVPDLIMQFHSATSGVALGQQDTSELVHKLAGLLSGYQHF